MVGGMVGMVGGRERKEVVDQLLSSLWYCSRSRCRGSSKKGLIDLYTEILSQLSYITPLNDAYIYILTIIHTCIHTIIVIYRKFDTI